MKYYARVKTNEKKEDKLLMFATLQVDPENILLDDQPQQKHADSIYSRLKAELAQTKEPLTIDDIFSLGKNAREVSKELEWFKCTGIELYVLTLPSTLETPVKRTNILYELNARYAQREIEKAKEGQKNSSQPVGRPRIPYPKNWDEEYNKWKRNETTSSEFMKAVGLSQGTFYNFLRHYKEELLQEEMSITREEQHNNR